MCCCLCRRSVMEDSALVKRKLFHIESKQSIYGKFSVVIAFVQGNEQFECVPVSQMPLSSQQVFETLRES